jgi:hypothetical protein
VYLDGVESSASGVSGSNVPANPLDILFGARRSTATDQNSGIGFSYSIKMDKVRFYNCGLSLGEVQSLFLNQK